MMQFSNMRSWRLHWDHQLYKALEYQYQLGLENLNQHLAEIPIELVYRYANLFLRYFLLNCLQCNVESLNYSFIDSKYFNFDLRWKKYA